MNHKNSIIRRMFANAQPSTSENTTLNNTNDTTIQSSPMANSRPSSPSIKANTKRNLFGIRLNHDQLKQDLTEMWKDQVDRQNQNWGFDFQKLKPIDAKKVVGRFEWTKVNTRMNPFYNETGVTTAVFDKDETKTNESDYETEPEEEEFDDALAIPQFYKYQRQHKLNQTKQNRLKFIQIAQKSTTPKQTSIKKPTITKSPKRSPTSKVQKNLIITFSENRKDTLRSSTTTTTTTVNCPKNIFESNDVLKSLPADRSAFKQPMKQQSLLDMLKQRKRKATTDEKVVETGHNLRPRTTSIN